MPLSVGSDDGVAEPSRCVNEIERAFPERPFTVEFWDGTRAPLDQRRRPDLPVRSPEAIAHALRAPGQLGIGRAYVAGEIEVDDLDAAMDLLNTWQPPPSTRRAQAPAVASPRSAPPA